MENKLDKALQFAAEKHKGQLRRGGEPYITHPEAVAEILREKGFNELYQITALFHDLLEDTDATEKEIRAIGGLRVLKAVKLLTKPAGSKEEVMPKYLAAIKKNKMAYQVKVADRIHNIRSMKEASGEFQEYYIADTKKWYGDFHEDILKELDRIEK